MKLDEFRLTTHEERSVIYQALAMISPWYRQQYAETITALERRLSATECQPGGCPFCNADRAAEEDEWRSD